MTEPRPHDSILVKLMATIYGWLIASVRPGDCDGAAEIASAYSNTGMIPFHLPGMAGRERESLYRQLRDAGMIVFGGMARGRTAGLTWNGVCRSISLTGDAVEELGTAFDVMALIESYAKAAGGPDVSPNGTVPEFLLAPEFGSWWRDCEPGDQRMMFVRSKLFNESLPALVMRWLTVKADVHGRRWFKLTDSGREALANPPRIPTGLPPENLLDFFLAEGDKAFEAACRSKPRDTNGVHIPIPASRWWTPKGGA